MPKIFYRTNSKTNWLTLRIFLSEMAKDKKRAITYSILIPLNRALYIVILPLVFSFVLQTVLTDPSNWAQALVLVGVGVIVAALSLVISWFAFSMLFKHEEQMRTELTKNAMTYLTNHSDQFFASRKVGALAGDVTNFGQSIISFLDNIFLNVSTVVMNFVVSLIVIAIIAPILLLPLGFATVFLIIHSIHSLNRRGHLRHERKVRNAELTGTIADILGNQQIVRFFGMRKKETERVLTERRKIQAISAQEVDVIQVESVVRQAVLFGTQILTVALCIVLFGFNIISIAALIFTITYLSRLTGSLFEITPIIRNLEQAFLDASNITEILQEEIEVSDVTRAKKLRVTDGKIEFKDVSFSYKDNSDDSVIQAMNLVIKPGQRVGLAGHSGGGKTTLSKLLLRFADVSQGAIEIDGQSISEVTQDSLHGAIAYVPQEAYLFHRSLRENIAYGRPDASDKEILEAAKKANALEFIEKLPDGIDTIVGERGVKLSGGQRQRIAIARAILKDAPILVLDEATSALDSESEKQIQAALGTVMKGRTSVVIAHRLSTIARLDRIIVLDHGRIIEDGTHKELLELNGVYASLWSHQSGGFIDE
jgi:ATP-binding cassette subfamily B protein